MISHIYWCITKPVGVGGRWHVPRFGAFQGRKGVWGATKMRPSGISNPCKWCNLQGLLGDFWEGVSFGGPKVRKFEPRRPTSCFPAIDCAEGRADPKRLGDDDPGEPLLVARATLGPRGMAGGGADAAGNAVLMRSLEIRPDSDPVTVTSHSTYDALGASDPGHGCQRQRGELAGIWGDLLGRKRVGVHANSSTASTSPSSMRTPRTLT